VRVGLIACSKGKLSQPAAARDLYTGPLFQLSKQWVLSRYDEKLGPINEWAILSAKYGLVVPSLVIRPYDEALSKMKEPQRKEWAESTRHQLRVVWGKDVIYMVLAGHHYKRALDGMPMVEDVFKSWVDARRSSGMSSRRAEMGIGLIKKYLVNNVGFAETLEKT